MIKEFTLDQISLTEAKFRATELKFQIEPLCEQFAIAGSVRRGEPFVKDIEIVCVPKFKERINNKELFPRPQLINEVIHWIEKPENNNVNVRKGGPKYQQIIYNNTIQVDIFMTTSTQFGKDLAIRTGPANYSKKMASRWVDLGYHSNNNVIRKNGSGEAAGPFLTEESFFDFLGWNYIKPEARI